MMLHCEGVWSCIKGLIRRGIAWPVAYLQDHIHNEGVRRSKQRTSKHLYSLQLVPGRGKGGPSQRLATIV